MTPADNIEQKESPPRSMAYAYASAVVAAIVGSYVGAMATIRERFYRDVRLSSGLQTGRTDVKKYREDLDNISTKFFKHDISAVEWFTQTGTRKREFKDAIDTAVREAGHSIDGFKGYTIGLWQRYQSMSPHVKQSVKVNSAITASVAAIGVLGFFINRVNSERMESMQTQLDNISESLNGRR